MGHEIPFSEKPNRYFRRRNPPSLALDRDRAWVAILKDLAHFAIQPVNLAEQGVPHCVCPVRTADKSDGSARFVHNSTRVNRTVVPEKVKCKLESLLKARNIFIKGGFVVGLDFASGYHCLAMHEKHRTYLAFALDIDELPVYAVSWLRERYPKSLHKTKNCFVFEYTALAFGLSSSCRAFNDLVTSLTRFWRTCPPLGWTPHLGIQLQ